MNKTLALSLALLFAVASGQAGKASAGGWCSRNEDCNQFAGLCCSGFASNSSLTPYTQLNCVTHVIGNAVRKTNNCLINGTDYKAICADEDKTCVNPSTNYVACGNSFIMGTLDLVNSALNCTSKSSAMTLAASAFFAMIAALALLF
jgi:hypothetical protein